MYSAAPIGAAFSLSGGVAGDVFGCHGAVGGGGAFGGVGGGHTACPGGLGAGHRGQGGLRGAGGLMGGGGCGHDRGARGGLLGDHAVGIGADIGAAGAARKEGGSHDHRQQQAQDLFHFITSCQNADGVSVPQSTRTKQGNFQSIGKILNLSIDLYQNMVYNGSVKNNSEKEIDFYEEAVRQEGLRVHGLPAVCPGLL